MQLQPSNHTRSAPPLHAADLVLTAVTPLALEIGLLFFCLFLWSLHLTPFLSLPWRHRTAWMRTAFFSGGDLRVTRAALPRCAWAKRTVQVKREEGWSAARMLDVCHLINSVCWKRERGVWMVGDVMGAPNLSCVCKRASFYFMAFLKLR